jgi:acyl-homoserine-lactone acylase
MLVHRLACLPALICLLSCSSDHSAAESTAIAGYDTEIRWTSYGIPHVKANNWESLGYGFAYATATDAVCVIARDGQRQSISLHGRRKQQL